MANTEREALWKERVARRLTAVDAAAALLRVSIQPAASAAPAIGLRSPSGWTVTLPTSWVVELLRALA